MSTEILFDPATCPSHLSSSIDDLTSALSPLLGQDWADTLDNLDPLERAKMDVMMAYTVVDLIWVYLKMKGVDPAKHEVSSELERVREYYNKIKKIESPETRKYKIDVPAAGRFISHSIPKSQRLAQEDPGSSASGSARAGRDRAIAEQNEEMGMGKYNRMRFVAGEAERVVPGRGAEGDVEMDESDEEEEVEEGEEEEEKEEEAGEDEEGMPGEDEEGEEGDEDVAETSEEEEEPIEDRSADKLLAEVEMSLRESKRKRAEES